MNQLSVELIRRLFLSPKREKQNSFYLLIFFSDVCWGVGELDEVTRGDKRDLDHHQQLAWTKKKA